MSFKKWSIVSVTGLVLVVGGLYLTSEMKNHKQQPDQSTLSASEESSNVKPEVSYSTSLTTDPFPLVTNKQTGIMLTLEKNGKPVKNVSFNFEVTYKKNGVVQHNEVLTPVFKEDTTGINNGIGFYYATFIPKTSGKYTIVANLGDEF